MIHRMTYQSIGIVGYCFFTEFTEKRNFSLITFGVYISDIPQNKIAYNLTDSLVYCVLVWRVCEYNGALGT